MIKRNDIKLLAVIIFIALAALLVFYVTRSEGARVVITINGEEYKTLPLDQDTSLTIETGRGKSNTVVIKDGSVDMTEADCPDKVCVKHAPIHYNGETIVCLPHKLVLQITGGEESMTDAIAR